MRSDYGLYLIAIICFLITGVVLAYAFPSYLPDPTTMEGITVWIVFLVLGVIFAIIGYSVRPKIAMPAPPKPPAVPVAAQVQEAPETPEAPAPKPEPTPPPEEEVAAKVEEVMPAAIPPSPTQAPTPEEPAKMEKEEKPKEKRVRRRRKKRLNN
jgi:outer membrane biosynthesis protein TonB